RPGGADWRWLPVLGPDTNRSGPDQGEDRSKAGGTGTVAGFIRLRIHSAIQPRRQPVAGRHRRLARCRRKPYFRRDDGTETHHGGRPHRSNQALARGVRLGRLAFRSLVVPGWPIHNRRAKMLTFRSDRYQLPVTNGINQEEAPMADFDLIIRGGTVV